VLGFVVYQSVCVICSVTNGEVRFASDDCSKRVKVTLQVNEVTVTARSSNGSIDNFFL